MLRADLENRFTHHPPSSQAEIDIYQKVRGLAYAYALTLDEVCPESRELSLAITHLEEVVFWANAALARNPVYQDPTFVRGNETIDRLIARRDNFTEDVRLDGGVTDQVSDSSGPSGTGWCAPSP